MLKVICVNNGFILNGAGRLNDAIELTENEIYTVIETGVSSFGTHFYILLEVKSISINGAYNSKRFIPLSNIDETELIKERQEYKTTV